MNITIVTAGLPVSDLDSQADRLRSLGIITDQQIEDVPGIIRYLDFTDPDGNGLSFYWLYPQEQQH